MLTQFCSCRAKRYAVSTSGTQTNDEWSPTSTSRTSQLIIYKTTWHSKKHTRKVWIKYCFLGNEYFPSWKSGKSMYNYDELSSMPLYQFIPPILLVTIYSQIWHMLYSASLEPCKGVARLEKSHTGLCVNFRNTAQTQYTICFQSSDMPDLVQPLNISFSSINVRCFDFSRAKPPCLALDFLCDRGCSNVSACVSNLLPL